MKKYIVEFLGTFIFVFTVGMAVHSGSVLAPLAIGSVLMVMVFAGGHISGGHFNPAVTLGVWLRGKCDTKDVIPYWIAQFGASLLASLLVIHIQGKPLLAASHAVTPSLIVEFIFTFALVWVVLNTATAKGTANNSFYGLAIGFTVVVGAISVGGISGGAFNPAIGFGVFTMGFEKLQQFWIYLGADLVGGAVAAIMFKLTHESGE